METSETGIALIKAFEGCLWPVPRQLGFFRAYRCPAGVLTIGWGTTCEHGVTFDENTVWSQDQCDDALELHLAAFEVHVTRCLQGAPVTQGQFDALVSWAYNTVGPATSTVWAKVRAGDTEGVCAVLMKWTKGGGRVLPGLVRRRAAECALYRGDLALMRHLAQLDAPELKAVPGKTSRPRTPVRAMAATPVAGGAVGAVAATSALIAVGSFPPWWVFVGCLAALALAARAAWLVHRDYA